MGPRRNESKHSPVAVNAHKLDFHLNGVIHGQSEKIQNKKSQSEKVEGKKGQEVHPPHSRRVARPSEENQGEKEQSAEAKKSRPQQAESQGRQESRAQEEKTDCRRRRLSGVAQLP
ncbi:MAG TPA: hypothetical protein VII48_03515 [Rhizomicrobium sp.]